MTTTMNNVDFLGKQMANWAMEGAASALRGKKVSDELIDAVIAELKVSAKTATDEGLRDAKNAVDAGMTLYAEVTLKATMFSAGVKAANKAMTLAGVRS